MTGGIFLIQDEGHLLEMKETEYDSENLLQELLEKYPNLLSGEQVDSDVPRKWLLISREMSLISEEGGDRWYIDHLFIDQDGIPTLVEVKRSTDTRIRREVVGQMLDYAANAVVYWPMETIRAQFESNHNGQNYSETIKKALGPEIDENQLWQNVKTNLQAGRIRMLFVADKIPVELKRIVEFLNGQMDPAEVLAFEIPQYQGEGLKALAPKIIGQTAEASRKKVSQDGREWDEISFIQDIRSRRTEEEALIANKIMDYSKKKKLRFSWGRGKVDASLYPVLDYNENEYWMIGLWSNGYIELQFQWMKTRPVFNDESKRTALLDKLNAIPGINIPKNKINSRPSFPLAILGNEQSYKEFTSVMDWYYEEIMKSSS